MIVSGMSGNEAYCLAQEGHSAGKIVVGNSVVSDLHTLSGYMDLYCQTDAGDTPVRFAMGNVAFALGIGRGVIGGDLRDVADLDADLQEFRGARLGHGPSSPRILPQGGSDGFIVGRRERRGRMTYVEVDGQPSPR